MRAVGSRFVVRIKIEYAIPGKKVRFAQVQFFLRIRVVNDGTSSKYGLDDVMMIVRPKVREGLSHSL